MTSVFATASIAELADGYRRRAFSPVEVVSDLLAHIESLDVHVNAFYVLSPERALAEARRCEADFMHDRAGGSLHGIPFAAKDLFDSKDLRTTYGSRIFAQHMPNRDAAAVRRLKEAGAILLGKTATHEFAWGITTSNPHFGATRNPWQTNLVPGGSSGGSGVALAMGMVPAALGTDTGGSIRIPASFCGVVGLKPTFQRISAEGVFPLAASLDHPGPMARTVEDAAMLLNVLAGREPGDASSARQPVPDYTDGLNRGISGLRIGQCPDLHLLPLNSQIQHVFDESIRLLADLGAAIVEVSLPTAPHIEAAYRVLQLAEAYHVHHHQRQLFPARASLYGADVAERLRQAASIDLAAYIEARAVQLRVTSELEEILSRDVDVLVTPVTAVPPPPIGSDTVFAGGKEVPFRSAVLPYTTPQDLAGLPACAFRAGFDDSGLPVGLQVTGRPWDEHTVLRVSNAFYQATASIQQQWPRPVAAPRD
jgi:aspartyl-tRNA(Asn)/glutamyl-tRNA(Gln) amidotransferase subunit A